MAPGPWGSSSSFLNSSSSSSLFPNAPTPYERNRLPPPSLSQPRLTSSVQPAPSLFPPSGKPLEGCGETNEQARDRGVSAGRRREGTAPVWGLPGGRGRGENATSQGVASKRGQPWYENPPSQRDGVGRRQDQHGGEFATPAERWGEETESAVGGKGLARDSTSLKVARVLGSYGKSILLGLLGIPQNG